MLNNEQMDQVRYTYERTYVVYVDPDIPKTNPFDLLTDLLQAFASHLQRWTIESCELMRSILSACDMLSYNDPSVDTPVPTSHIVGDMIFQEWKDSICTGSVTDNVEDDMVSILWRGRAAHARALSRAVANRLSRISSDVIESKASPSMTQANLLRLEVLVHPLPLRGICSFVEIISDKCIDWNLFLDYPTATVTQTPLYWMAYAAFVIHKHIDQGFNEESCEKLHTLAYFLAHEKVGDRMTVAPDTPMTGEYQPYWALDFSKCPKSFDASDFLYVYIQDLIEKYPKLIATKVGRRILRSIVLFVGEMIVQEWNQQPLLPKWDAPLAEKVFYPVSASVEKRPLSPAPPPESSDLEVLSEDIIYDDNDFVEKEAKRAKTDV